MLRPARPALQRLLVLVAEACLVIVAGHGTPGTSTLNGHPVKVQPLDPPKSASGNLPYVLVITWPYSRLHVEAAAWADTYAALFANFALTPNCVCHVQPVRAEQPSEFGALAVVSG